MPHHDPHKLTPSELAEAEATGDVTDADIIGPVARRAAEMPLHPGVTDSELARADCDSDLAHGEPAR